jgi:hypothetical protein
MHEWAMGRWGDKRVIGFVIEKVIGFAVIEKVIGQEKTIVQNIAKKSDKWYLTQKYAQRICKLRFHQSKCENEYFTK